MTKNLLTKEKRKKNELRNLRDIYRSKCLSFITSVTHDIDLFYYFDVLSHLENTKIFR